MTSVDSNFNFLCGHTHGAGPPSPIHMRPSEPDPLRVDVIDGWPPTGNAHSGINKNHILELGENLEIYLRILSQSSKKISDHIGQTVKMPNPTTIGLLL